MKPLEDPNTCKNDTVVVMTAMGPHHSDAWAYFGPKAVYMTTPVYQRLIEVYDKVPKMGENGFEWKWRESYWG